MSKFREVGKNKVHIMFFFSRSVFLTGFLEPIKFSRRRHKTYKTQNFSGEPKMVHINLPGEANCTTRAHQNFVRTDTIFQEYPQEQMFCKVVSSDAFEG